MQALNLTDVSDENKKRAAEIKAEANKAFGGVCVYNILSSPEVLKDEPI
jgi:hypothetical protein